MKAMMFPSSLIAGSRLSSAKKGEVPTPPAAGGGTPGVGRRLAGVFVTAGKNVPLRSSEKSVPKVKSTSEAVKRKSQISEFASFARSPSVPSKFPGFGALEVKTIV